MCPENAIERSGLLETSCNKKFMLLVNIVDYRKYVGGKSV